MAKQVDPAEAKRKLQDSSYLHQEIDSALRPPQVDAVLSDIYFRYSEEQKYRALLSPFALVNKTSAVASPSSKPTAPNAF